MQGGDDGHAKSAQQLQHMTACRSAEDSELVLQTNQIDFAEIQIFRSLSVRR
jgi:hypothetical protein